MPLRPGEEEKLAPEAEQAHLDELRRQRDAKARMKLQLEAQSLAMDLGELSLSDLPAKAKELAADKKFGGALLPAATAIMWNTVVRNGVPPREEEADAKTPRGGKKGGGGGGKHKGSNKPVKAVDRPPATAAETRKAVKAHKHIVVAKPIAAQRCLIEAVEAWLLSTHGSAALPGAAKVVEVLYDVDAVSEAVLTEFWADLQAATVRDTAALEAAKVAFAQQQTAETAAAAEVKNAEAAQREAEKYKKNSETYAQNARCGGNPTKEDEIYEKAAIAQLKKALELHTQSQKVFAARQKTLVAESGALTEAGHALTACQAEVDRRAPFAKHAAPFFDWLAASDDESDDEDAAASKKAPDGDAAAASKKAADVDLN